MKLGFCLEHVILHSPTPWAVRWGQCEMSFLVSSETNYHAWTQTAQCAAEQPHPTCSSGSGGKGCQECSLSIDSRPGCDFLSPLKHHFASAQNCSKWQEFAHIIKRGKGKTGREKNLEKSGKKKKKKRTWHRIVKNLVFWWILIYLDFTLQWMNYSSSHCQNNPSFRSRTQ